MTFSSDFSSDYIAETHAILDALDLDAIDAITEHLRNLEGRLFILGVGGSAATASHAVNDFRKLAGIEAYAPTDNVAELTARTNDDGWATTFYEWLDTSRACSTDALLVLSVGGGSLKVSPNITNVLGVARARGVTVLGIVGRDGGRTAQMADACLIVPPLFPERVTPHTESVASIVLHLIVTDLCSQ